MFYVRPSVSKSAQCSKGLLAEGQQKKNLKKHLHLACGSASIMTGTNRTLCNRRTLNSKMSQSKDGMTLIQMQEYCQRTTTRSARTVLKFFIKKTSRIYAKTVKGYCPGRKAALGNSSVNSRSRTITTA